MSRIRLAALAFGLAALAAAAAPAQTIPEAPIRPTEIESVRLRVENDGESAYFIFSDQVLLSATNLILRCDTLEVFARRDAEAEAVMGTVGAIQKIIATGNVRIEQAQRVATAGKAVVEPNKERIVLTEKPVVTQAGTRLEADELIIERGNGTIVVNPNTPNKLRFVGPPITDMGFEKDPPPPPIDEEAASAESEEAQAEAQDAESPRAESDPAPAPENENGPKPEQSRNAKRK